VVCGIYFVIRTIRPTNYTTMASDDIITIALELSRHMRRKMNCDAREKHEINYLRSYALSFIKETKNMTMSGFAESMKISASSATAFVDRLCKEGWVKRSADPVNRKIVHLALTAAGEKVLLRHQEEKRLFLADILALIPEADRKHLARILQNLHLALHTLPTDSH
jgi:DNA-binding MarR family transcriptional regulator